MYISVMKSLCFYFVLCQGVNSARYPLLKKVIPSNCRTDAVLKRFFKDFKEVFLKVYEPRHITILGATSSHVEQTRPLLESYPYVIYTEPEEFRYPRELSPGSLVVFFLANLNKQTYYQNYDVLSRCRECRVLFVFNGIVERDKIWLMFHLPVQDTIRYIEFAHVNDGVVKLYGDFFTPKCSLNIRLKTVWQEDFGFDRARKNVDQQRRNFNRCPVHVTTTIFQPKMVIKNNFNGSLTIIGGREGQLLLVLADKLNFTLALKYPVMAQRTGFSKKIGVSWDVVVGTSEIGIGRLRPTNYLRGAVTMSVPYDEECVVWAVPRMIRWQNDTVLVEFSSNVWIWVGLIFIISCATEHAHQNIWVAKSDKRSRPGFGAILLDVIQTHFGNPVHHESSSTGGRVMLLVYLFYATVMTTAYKSSLASILATDRGTQQIVDEEGIINENLVVGGTFDEFQVLNDQVNESAITPIMIERFMVDNNDTNISQKLKYDANYALLTRASYVNYEKQEIIRDHESLRFHTFGDCVLKYPVVMAFSNKSYLREPIDNIILRLTEAGIMEYWDLGETNAKNILSSKNPDEFSETQSVYKILSIFYIYCGCIVLCLISFIMEFLIPRLISKYCHNAITTTNLPVTKNKFHLIHRSIIDHLGEPRLDIKNNRKLYWTRDLVD